jgi:hypothetical protein
MDDRWQAEFQLELSIESNLIIAAEFQRGNGSSETDSEGVQKWKWFGFVLGEQCSKREPGPL